MDRLLYTDLNKLIFQLAGGFPKAHARHATDEAVWPALSYYLTLSVWLFSTILGLPVLQGPNKPSLISVEDFTANGEYISVQERERYASRWTACVPLAEA